MAITVVDADGDVQTFTDANTWHVDEKQNLHLRSQQNRAVASFAVGFWQSVGRAEEGR